MSKGNRMRLKRMMQQNADNLDKILQSLKDICDIYGDNYPQYTDPIELIAGALSEIHIVMEQISKVM